jgi:hypothetical protein
MLGDLNAKFVEEMEGTKLQVQGASNDSRKKLTSQPVKIL